MTTTAMFRRAGAEFLGTGLLVTVVVGSGIAASRLSSDRGLQLLENSIATTFGLAVLILMLGPVSGAHFNPAVSMVDAALGRRRGTGLSAPMLGAYLVAQVAGGIGGTLLASAMFAVPAAVSTTDRATPATVLGEVVATAGLILLIVALARTEQHTAVIAAAVGAYIGGRLLFTSSTSFANPAVTVARIFTDTFAGIAPASVLPFLAAQLAGAAIGAGLAVALFPRASIVVADILVPHALTEPEEETPMTHIVAIGGSDAGISAALRARELDPAVDVTVVVADAYPNYSICGIPYFFSGDVQPWQSLAHRTHADLEATGMRLRLDTLAAGIDVAGQQLTVRDQHGTESLIGYDELIVGTGALPAHAGIAGLDRLGPDDGVHVIHSMGDTFALERHLTERTPATAIIIGAGYVGLEMAEGFTGRGIEVTQLQRGPEVLSTLDPHLASLVHTELTDHGVTVHTDTTVRGIEKTATGLTVHAEHHGQPVTHTADLVLAVVGVRPNTTLLEYAGATLGPRRAVVVDEQMRTGLPHVFAAGDGVVTHHRLLGTTYLPLGTTAHKQGRVAGENALGGTARFAGSVGTQVVKVFDLVAARTGLRDDEALIAGYQPMTTQAVADDHKRYYPGAQPISIRITGDTTTGRLLGAQLVGRLGTETAKRVDTYATAVFAGLTVEQVSDLDLSYTPPLGSPWDAVQVATQTWTRSTMKAAALA